MAQLPKDSPGTKDARSNASGAKASERAHLQSELDRLEGALGELKVQYEQYFSGLLPRAPEKAHQEIKNFLRLLRKAPFKTSAINFRLKALENRYSTYNSYWQRVFRERDEGKYSKDIFRANLREKVVAEHARLATPEGRTEKGIEELFRTYKSALEKETGKPHDLDFKAFQKSLVQKAKAFKDQHGAEKLSFKIVVKDGKVSVQAKTKS